MTMKACSNLCPNCGKDGHVTTERIVTAQSAVTQCFCRICGHIWVPMMRPRLGKKN